MEMIRVKLKEGKVPLPTFILSKLHGDETADVLVPLEYLDARAQLDESAIRRIYRGQPLWDRPGVVDGVQVEEDPDA